MRRLMRFSIWVIMIVVVLALFMTGCGKQENISEKQSTPETSAAKIESTTTVRLSGGKDNSPMWLEVTKGRYTLGGDVLLQGSSMGISEAQLTYYPGLEIEIAADGIVLKGKSYSNGTVLLVNNSGSLDEVAK